MLRVLYTLSKHGYEANLVGGAVRDLLLDKEPKDFDVATNATPEQVKAIFRNCRLIGRRFRLAHIHFGRHIVEVATYRASHQNQNEGGVVSEDGRILRDNVYGNIEEDAIRRDFTVNALYYNIADFSIIDYAGGVTDLNNKLLRLIGDPEKRYREDPVRMLRAIRFSVKLGFEIEEKSEKPIHELKCLLADIPPARLFEENLKLFMGGDALENFKAINNYGIFEMMFPLATKWLNGKDGDIANRIITQALINTDKRIRNNMHVTPAFLLAIFLWGAVSHLQKQHQSRGENQYQALNMAIEDVMSQQIRHVSIPKRFSIVMKEIWRLQIRLPRRNGQRAFKLIAHQRFRAAYDFLLLRAQGGDADQDLCDWWTHFQEKGEKERKIMVASLSKSVSSKKRKN